MIRYDKSLSLPAFTTRRIERKLRLFQESEGALYCRGTHFREEEGGLVFAEGSEYISDLPADCVDLVLSAGYAPEQFYLSYGGHVTRMKDGKFFDIHKPNKILIYRAQDGKEKLIAITDADVYFHDGTLGKQLVGMEGGKTACLAYERLFTAKDEFIRWSNPLEPENFSRSLSGAGYAELPSPEGNILEMMLFSDVLLLIRERGITVLHVKGEPLSYTAEPVACSFGRIFESTVQLCGEKVIFLTEGGLCAFDGKHIRRIPGCGFEDVDIKASNFNSASVHGIYYAAVVMKDGEKRLWVVDPEEKKGHFSCIPSRMIIGGDELLFGLSGKLYRLKARGIPFGGECARLYVERTLLGLSVREKLLDGISFDGEGFLTIEAISEHGKRCRVFGRAGEHMRFQTPLRGTSFAFSIETVCEGVRIRSLTFDVREEEVWKSTSLR